MLNRMDFVKCFDLLTKQEIKNYQDSLNFVLQSLQDLKERSTDIQNHFLENHALLHSNQNDLAIENEKLRADCRSLRETLERSLRDQELINKKHTAELNAITSEMYSFKNHRENTQDKFENCWKEFSQIRSGIIDNNRVYHDNLDDLLRRFRQEIEQAKREVREAPTEAEKVRADLEQEIGTHKVDVRGLMREIQVYKADATISEKKIEHLYTLFERLKKSSEVAP